MRLIWILIENHVFNLVCKNKKHEKCNFFLDISSFSWSFNILNEIFNSLFELAKKYDKFQKEISKLFEYIQSKLKINEYLFLNIDDFSKKTPKQNLDLLESLKNSCCINFLDCDEKEKEHQISYHIEYREYLNGLLKNSKQSIQKSFMKDYQWYFYFNSIRNFLFHENVRNNIIPPEFKLFEIISLYNKTTTDNLHNYFLGLRLKRYKDFNSENNQFIFTFNKNKKHVRYGKFNIKVNILKKLLYEILLYFFEYINLPETKSKWKKILFYKESKPKTKSLKSNSKEYDVKIFDFKDVNSNSKSNFYDLKIYYKYFHKNHNKYKKWILESKPSNENKWNKRKYNWNWKHKGAHLGKLLQFYIKKNQMFLFKNIINFEGYNKQQPDFYIVFLFMFIFEFEKNPNNIAKIWWENNFVDYYWYEDWSWEFARTLLPISTFIENIITAIIIENIITAINKIIKTKDVIKVEFKYYENLKFNKEFIF